MVGFTFASCNGDYDDWSTPQTNGPENAITIPGFKATATDAVNLANPGENVQTFTLSTAALPEGAELGHTRVVMTPSDEAAATSVASQTLDATASGTIDSTALQTAVVKAYGRRPSERLFKAHVYSDVVVEGQALFVDAGEININVTPKAPHISTAYYVAGDMTSWLEFDKLAKFTHSDKDLYDDPVFTVVITTTKADQYWKIIPQENVDAGNMWAEGVLGVKVNGSTDTEGTLVTDNPQAGKLAEAGTYVISLNMLEYTYSITKADSYYMVGGVYGWNAEAASKLAFYCDGGSKASITTLWTGDANLKIWTRNDIGNWDVAWGSVTDGDNASQGDLISNNGQAFVCPEKGMYYTLNIDMSTHKYSWAKCENQNPASFQNVSLIGSFNGHNWDTDIDMQQTAPHNWYLHYTFSSPAELKFRSNHDWSSANWGGHPVKLADMVYAGETGGDNLNIAAGTYNIYFNDITGKFMFIEE